VGWFDDAEVRRVKQERERAESERLRWEHQRQTEHQELLAFTIEGLREFPAAARQAGLQPEKRVVARCGTVRPKTKDAWLLMTSVIDNSYLYRCWVDTDGGVWMDDDASDVERVARWLAKTCEYRPESIRETLTAALAGVPLTKAY
jgi:hypothetical protein